MISVSKGSLDARIGAELRLGNWLPDHESASRTDVDGVEVFQLFGERGRSEGPVTPTLTPRSRTTSASVPSHRF
jgi:hypothetical protein